MANKMIAIALETGITTGKFVRTRQSDNFYWHTNGTPGFEVYSAANIANYGIAGTETGSTGTYSVDDPSPTTSGKFWFVKAAGASLVVSDLANNIRYDDVAGPVAAGSVSLADGSITEATFTTPSEASGRPSGILGMIRRTFERFANKRTRNRTTGIVTVRDAADSSDLETQTQSTSGVVDTQTQGS